MPLIDAGHVASLLNIEGMHHQQIDFTSTHVHLLVPIAGGVHGDVVDGCSLARGTHPNLQIKPSCVRTTAQRPTPAVRRLETVLQLIGGMFARSSDPPGVGGKEVDFDNISDRPAPIQAIQTIR